MAGSARHVGAWFVWWVVLFWLWLLLAGDWNRIEWIAAAAAATVGATVSEAARALSGIRARVTLRAVVSAWTVPAMVLVDFVLIVGALLISPIRRRMIRGRFLSREFERESGSAPVRFGDRAWRSYAATVSPNAYVVDVDEEKRVVLLHDLVPFQKSEEPAA